MLYHLMGADLAYYDGRGAEQQARARLALEMGEASGDPTAALEAWFQTLLYRQPAEAARVAERALALVRRALGQEREAEWLTRRALALLEAGQYAQAIDAADDARRASVSHSDSGAPASHTDRTFRTVDIDFPFVRIADPDENIAIGIDRIGDPIDKIGDAIDSVANPIDRFRVPLAWC